MPKDRTGEGDRDRTRHHVTAPRRALRARPPLALSDVEQDLLLGVLDSERFADMSPAAVYATLLDEGRYHGFDPHHVSAAGRPPPNR
jgi:hypothetical protein